MRDRILLSYNEDKFFKKYNSKNNYTFLLDNCEWEVYESDYYIHCIPKNAVIPKQGWKVHISSIVSTYEEILKEVANYLIKNKISFKYIKSNEIAKLYTQRFIPRGSYGKFITIYPKNFKMFEKIISDLYSFTTKYKGPYILTDKRYKDSLVLYYRYGSNRASNTMDSDGDLISDITLLDGRNVLDKRNPSCNINNWPFIPFEKEDSVESILFKKYKNITPIHFSVSGGIYVANSLNNEKVVIKEARPYTLSTVEGIDSIVLRKNEENAIKKLEEYAFFPKYIDSFYDWENYYLVVSFVEGENLQEHIINTNPFNGSSNKNVYEYFVEIKHYLIEVIKIYYILKNKNIVIEDFKLENFIVSSNIIKLIDLENDDKVRLSTINIKNGNDTLQSYLLNFLYYFIFCRYRFNNESDNELISYIEKNIRLYGYEIENLDKIYDLNSKDDYIVFINNLNFKKIDVKNNFNCEEIYERLKLGYILSQKRDIVNSPRYNTDNCISTNNMPYFIMEKIYEKMEVKQEDIEKLPVGLLNGKLGIAWALMCSDDFEKAYEIIISNIFNVSFEHDYSLGTGISGLILVISKYLANVYDYELIKILETLVSNLIVNIKKNDFKTKKGVKFYGYENGFTGIAASLFYANEILRINGLENVIKQIFQIDIDELTTIKEHNGLYLPYSEKENRKKSPCFMVGSGGVAALSLRLYIKYNDNYYLDIFNKIYPALCAKNASQISFYYGLIGLGEVLLDAYQFLKLDKYLFDVKQILNYACQFYIQDKKEILVIGDYNLKYSGDLATGQLGLMHLINRVINKKENEYFFVKELDYETFIKV